MRIDILTLFPQMFEAVLGDSIIGRARKSGLVDLNFINIRDFSTDKHRRVDDYPYGGGGGMVMQAQPIYDAYMSIASEADQKPRLVYMSPKGKVLTQKVVVQLSEEKHIVLLCGHYEGIDQRVIDEIVDEEISLGDFVLTGGEIVAMAVTDAVVRFLPGVLATEDSFINESHYNGLLEYPQYTRPEEFRGKRVPDVLLSGHHANIVKWQKEQSIAITKQRRPDLMERHS